MRRFQPSLTLLVALLSLAGCGSGEEVSEEVPEVSVEACTAWLRWQRVPRSDAACVLAASCNAGAVHQYTCGRREGLYDPSVRYSYFVRTSDGRAIGMSYFSAGGAHSCVPSMVRDCVPEEKPVTGFSARPPGGAQP